MDLAKYLKGLSSRFNKTTDRVENKVLLALDRAGQRLVDIARESKTYQDETGNLTASIGYGVYHKGEEFSIGGFGGGNGEKEGVKRLSDVASKHKSKAYVLVVVAGMEYAIYVERSGYIVLDVAKLKANSVITEELNKVKVYIA